jgi:hypothetical protein
VSSILEQSGSNVKMPKLMQLDTINCCPSTDSLDNNLMTESVGGSLFMPEMQESVRIYSMEMTLDQQLLQSKD